MSPVLPARGLVTTGKIILLKKSGKFVYEPYVSDGFLNTVMGLRNIDY
jgi:hypothetical protein